MQIGCIQLLEFRNYPDLTYRPDPRLNLLTGRNGQGKTNLLEALAVLLTGRSFRTSRVGDLPRWGVTGAAVSGEVTRAEGARSVRRTLRQLENGAWHVSGDGCPWARVIVFGWQDLAILNGPPAARRSFVDGFAARLYSSHLPALLRYRQVVERRNRLLQGHAPADRLAPWDEQLATVGMELIDRRRRAVAALQTEIGRVYPALTGERHKVHVEYRAGVGEATEPAALLEALARARAAEQRRGVTLVGPHRDDVAIELDGVDARAYGSRGQQRLLALGLRLAEVLPVTEAAGTAPVLLLDDALSELDEVARDNVLREIRTAEQVFLTSPEPLRVAGAARWSVEGGGIAAA
ncbi:MAG TPA: DNA replication and repair protein RecF [Candidatus Tectomicrobia bacterium]|nr:DNA replication and repair protein RecF [Candidatus Tectomicrobia bacterium]